MYKLYNVKAWGSVGIQLLLEELDVPYTNIWMTPEQVRAPEFREASPLGYIPALGLQDGRSLFESAAIVTFLLTRHPGKHMSPEPGSEDWGEFLSWLQFMASNLYPAINMSYAEGPFAMNKAHDAFIIKKATDRCHALWSVIEARLASSGPWLMGKTFSALDLYAFMLALWGPPNEQGILAKFPNVARLAEGVRGRARLKAALEAHGVIEPGGYPR